MNEYARKRILAGVFVCFAMVIIGSVVLFSGREKPLVIERNSYGEGSREETVYLDDEPVVFTVGELEYTEEELDQAFDSAFAAVRKDVLGTNSSAEEIRSDLNFIDEISEGLAVEWISSDPEVILSDGQVMNQDWEEGTSELVTVTVVLSYGDRMEQEDLIFRVLSPIRDEEEELLLKVQKRIQEIERNTRSQSSFTLPEEIDHITLTKEPGQGPGSAIFLLFTAIAIPGILRKNREEEKERNRSEAIKTEYPIFVNQIILYLGAGMSLKNTFDTICREYQENSGSGTSEAGFLYRELCTMRNEMSAGVGERQAYENFGRRTGEQSYMILMSLLLQNLQKGNEGLLAALHSEEEAAFHKRLDQARTKGEKAGTKLLFPMLILLVVVMVIVMAPALLEFGSY